MNRINPQPDINPLKAAIAAVSIEEIWRFLKLPGEPGRRCRSPFRDDKDPSFSIFKGGHHWRDFGTDESGDLVGFIVKAKRTSRSNACRWLV